MPHEFKGGEKVVRTAVECEDCNYDAPVGTHGEVTGLYDGKHPTVQWEGQAGLITYGYFPKRFPVECLTLANAFELPPACSVKVCSAACSELKSELLEAQDQIAALGEERDALRGELGDAKGAADSWRSRAERAEKALDMLKVKR